MEINCPDCSQRLRVPDHLADPLVRCRTCGRTFRPSETESRSAFAPLVRMPQPPLPQEPADERPPIGAESSDAQLENFLTQARAEPSIADQTKSRQKAAGWGVGIVIALMLLKGGVRLVNNLLREDRKPPPAPVRFDNKPPPDVEKLLEEIKAQRRQPPLQPPPGELEDRPPEVSPLENPPAEK